MEETAEHYRQRAAHCRELAKTATDVVVIQRLIDLAEDFDAEARRLEEETPIEG